jgi:hypothetical protein
MHFREEPLTAAAMLPACMPLTRESLTSPLTPSDLMPLNQRVPGSSPGAPTNRIKRLENMFDAQSCQILPLGREWEDPVNRRPDQYNPRSPNACPPHRRPCIRHDGGRCAETHRKEQAHGHCLSSGHWSVTLRRTRSLWCWPRPGTSIPAGICRWTTRYQCSSRHARHEVCSSRGKLLRHVGDNGKHNDNMLMHILSPYAQHHSGVDGLHQAQQLRVH